MNGQRRIGSVFRRAAVSISGLCLYLLAAAVSAQPASGPPERITVEQAAKKLAGPTLITISLADAEPAAVFAAISDQTGVGFDSYSARGHLAELGKINVDYQQQPLWNVLLDLGRKWNIEFRPYDHPRFASRVGVVMEITPKKDPAMYGPMSKTDHFTIVASSTARRLILTGAESGSENQQVVMKFVVLVDPKVRVRGEPEGFDLKVIDEQGQLLPVDQFSGWTREVASQSPLVWHITAVAQLPDASVRKLQSIRGSLRIISTTQTQSWEVKDVLETNNAVTRISDTVFVVRTVAPCADERDGYEVTLSSWGTGEDTDIGWPSRSEFDRIGSVQLLDSRKNRFYPYQWKLKSSNDAIIYFNSRDQNSDEPTKPATLVWELPREVCEIVVPFEFKDVSLP